MLISRLSTADLLVIDTHIWVWASGESGGPTQIDADALSAMEDAARHRRLFACASSVWEIALKSQRGQSLISGDLHAWVRDQREHPGVRILPIDSRLAIESTELPPWLRKRDGQEHRDPNDRFIVASARRLNAVLLTCDEEIIDYARQGNVKVYDSRP